MPILNPMEPGDVPYPQYSVTTTQRIAAGVTILKGRVYSKNTLGELIVNVGTLVKGIFQAKATPTVNVPALAGDEVQVLGPRSRMLFVDFAGGLVEGDLVVNNSDSDEVIVTLSTTDPEFVGRVFEIYTRNTDATRKLVAATGDLVVVESVGP